MDKLVILTLNVRGLRNYRKRRDIISHFWFPVTDPRPHIFLLQETHSTADIEQQWSQEFQSRNIFFSHDTTSSGGLLTVIRSGLPFTVHHIIVRLSSLAVHCSIAGEECVIVNVYNKPTGTKDHCLKLVNWLHQTWQDAQRFPGHKILLGGDFNLQLHLSNNSYWNIQGQKIFREFLSETELTDCWSVLHPDELQHTFYAKTKKHCFVGSTLDYLFFSPLLANYLYSSSVGLQFQSDHCPLEATFLLNRNPRGPGVFRFPGYLLGDMSFCFIVTDMIKAIVTDCADDSPSLLWDKVKLAIKSRTLEYIADSRATL